MIDIISTSNEQIKHLKKLHAKKYRAEYKQYLIEGIKIIEEAYKSGKNILKLFVCYEKLEKNGINKEKIYELLSSNNYEVATISENVLEYISDTETPQGIVALMPIEDNSIDLGSKNLLILDNIQDTGNMGTILRTASAFGFNNIIVTSGSCDIYNPKVIRGSMGNIYKLNIKILGTNEKLSDIISDIKSNNYTIYTTEVENSKSIYDTEFKGKICIVFGNEANGVSDFLKQSADISITIPMRNDTESLNVSIATGIILSEVNRKNI